MFTEDVLPIIIQAFIPVVVALLGWLTKSATGALEGVRANAENATAARWAALIGTRLLDQIDQMIDRAATWTTGEMAKLRRPESPGGMAITADEWEDMLDRLARYVIDGLGTVWTDRLLQLIRPDLDAGGMTPTERTAAVMPYVRGAIESRYAERVDEALARGVRTDGPSPFLATAAG